MKERKSDVFSLFLDKYKDNDSLQVNDKDFVMASLMGINIYVKPNDIDIIESLTSENKIYIAIGFIPHESVKYIEEITWEIDDKNLCSFTFNNLKPLDYESFYVPKSIFLGYTNESNSKAMVKKKVTSYKFDKYYYGIEIKFDEENNEYIFKSIRNKVLFPSNHQNFLTNNRFCFLNINTTGYMYDRMLNVKIKKDEFIKNLGTINEDLLRILMSESKDNKFLKFVNEHKQRFLSKPFDLEKQHWDKPFDFLIRNIITDYPRYIANQLQENWDIRKFDKKHFKYKFER
jgi:hypothetical protein